MVFKPNTNLTNYRLYLIIFNHQFNYCCC